MRSRSSCASTSPSTTTVAISDDKLLTPSRFAGGGERRPSGGALRVALRGVCLGRLAAGLAAVQVVVPAAALQHERGARDLPARLRRPALGALLDGRLADALLALELVPAALAEVLVDRHRVPRSRAGWVSESACVRQRLEA